MDSAGKHFELLHNLHTAVVVHRPDTSILYCNKRATELLGLTEDQMLGKTVMDPTWRFVDEDGSQMSIAQYPVSVVINTKTSLEEMVLGVQSARQAQPLWLMVSAFPDFYADGTLKQVVVNFYSIRRRKAAEAKLAASAAQVDDLYNNAPCGYFSLDANGKFLHINNTALKWLGTTREMVIGKRTALDFLPDEQKAGFIERYKNFRTSGRVDDVEVDFVGVDGARRRVSVTATAVYDADGNFLMSRSVIYDVTVLHQTKSELERLHLEQDAMLDNDMIGIVKLQDRLAIWKNRALGRIFGYQPQELLGQPSRVLYKDDEQYESLGRQAYPILAAGGHYRAQLEMKRKDGSPVWIDISGVMLSPEQKTSMWLLADISELKAYQRKVEELAFHDGLTGLPNRLLFADRLKQAVAVAARTRSFFAVCYLDLDGFKPINDAHGHAAGDAVLKEVGCRLQATMRPNDTACRLGGDEFVLLLTQLENPNDFETALARATTELHKPIELDNDLRVTVGASIGVARYPIDGMDPEILLRNADRAMYQGKASGKNRVCVYVESDAGFHARE